MHGVLEDNHGFEDVRFAGTGWADHQCDRLHLQPRLRVTSEVSEPQGLDHLSHLTARSLQTTTGIIQGAFLSVPHYKFRLCAGIWRSGQLARVWNVLGPR